MSKRQWLSLLGVWVIVFLFLGFPSIWHKVIAIVTGLIIVLISYNLPAEKNDSLINNSSFIESKVKKEEEIKKVEEEVKI